MKAIEINQLNKVYANKIHALINLSFSIEQGDFFALLGANGAGKSSLISILTTLIRKTSGTIHIQGIDLDDDPNRVKTYLGVVPQEVNLNPFETCFQILLNQAAYYGLSRKHAKSRALDLLKQVELSDKKNSIARRLSGGMKRRLMLARALIHDPAILILDEPTAGVDIQIRQSIWEFLTALNQAGKTIILTTHYLEEAEKLCRHVGILNQGQLIQTTSINQLLTQTTHTLLQLHLRDPIMHAPILLNTECTLTSNQTLTLLTALSITELVDQLKQQKIHVQQISYERNRLETLLMQIINGKHG